MAETERSRRRPEITGVWLPVLGRLLALLLASTLILGFGPTRTECKDIMSVIPADYSKELSPADAGGKRPVKVSIALYITDISSINTKDMDFRIDAILRQTWADERLQPENYLSEGADHVLLSSKLLEALWKPDPMILNAKTTTLSELNDVFGSIVLYRDKNITYTIKVAVTVGCQMDFQDFPNDLQLCPMFIESFSSDVNDMILRWEKFDCAVAGHRYTAVEEGLCSGVGLAPDLKLLQFVVATPIPFSIQVTERLRGNSIATFSRLKVDFQFARVLTQYIVQTFVPSIFIICLSWFSFFMGLDSTPGRVTLPVTSQLTLVTMFASSVTAAIPPVSYLKAMDYWMLVCLFFVFIAQSEFVLVKCLDVMYRYQKTGSYYNVNPAAMLASPKKKKRPRFNRPSPIVPASPDTDPAEPGYFRQPGGNTAGDGSVFACLVRRNNLFANWRGTNGTRHEADVEKHGAGGDTSAVEGETDSGGIRLGWIDEKGRERLLWREIDITFRFVYPALFGLFNLIFWPMLFSRNF